MQLILHAPQPNRLGENSSKVILDAIEDKFHSAILDHPMGGVLLLEMEGVKSWMEYDSYEEAQREQERFTAARPKYSRVVLYEVYDA